MEAGDVFRFEGIADIHVWMIISDPRVEAAKVVMVNFTTWDSALDQACIVNIGEHPFIACQTLVNFARSKVVSNQQLENLKAAGRLISLAPLSPGLLQRIRDAAAVSVTMSIEHGEILLDQEPAE